MGPRPTHLNLRDNDRGISPNRPRPPYYMDLPSPRTGDVPPALSPLDAFAMQSRALAKRFDGSSQTGRRISRLPHMDVAKELGTRPGYFRSPSDESAAGMSDVPEDREDSNPTSPQQVQVEGEDERDRPVSHYPVFGHTARTSLGGKRLSTPPETPREYYDAEEEQEQGGPARENHDYFGISAPRASSPEPVDPKTVNIQAASPLNMPSLTNSVDSVQSTPQARTLTNGSTRSQRSLAPPRSPAYSKSPRSVQSVRSVPPDSDTEEGSVNGALAVGGARKFSGASSTSRPASPFSPWMAAPERSPSQGSQRSLPGGQQRRTNFSRPLSSGGSKTRAPQPRPSYESRSSQDTRPSGEMPARQDSNQSGIGYQSSGLSSGLSSRQQSQDDAPAPVPMAAAAPGQRGRRSPNPGARPSGPPGTHHGAHPGAHPGAPPGAQTGPNGAPSYIYAKYSLPRGRIVDRNSRGKRESWIQHQFTWDDRESSEPQQPNDSHNNDFRFPNRAASPAGSEKLPQQRLGRERAQSSANRSRSADPRSHDQTPSPIPPSLQAGTPAPAVKTPPAQHRPSLSLRSQTTTSTNRTLKADPSLALHQRTTSTELTPEEHLEIGIQAHSAGHLTKSTYHLRLAARAGAPTAMLLYALACRHGWGMRPNQADGVAWLRKAIESSGLEVADVEATIGNATTAGADGKAKNSPAAVAERKTRKAQFALAIYELGISYMNGWGCPKDKPLAVRCYEVAGSWGDCDALAEAGFCYTQGVGCRKDFKRAAGLYRRAAEGGMGMAGNSWIYKPKYMDSPADAPAAAADKSSPAKMQPTRTDTSGLLKDEREREREKEKEKPQTRQRSRSLWGRKKS